MSLARPLSLLEATVLGVVLKRGPCLAHAVIVEFADSHTLAYRSGAGAIYPLLKRLTEAGYLAQSARRYAITEAGTAALREWILPPYQSGDISTNLDGIRSRAYFLKLLDPEEIALFTHAARSALEELLESCRRTLAQYQASGDPFSEAAMLGAIYETEARIRWIDELRRRFVQTD